ncbi:uncharacterized protein TNCV_444371 [Trichonephila clavipes]|nr:uncharacterized protein TNCV_444371 [Trichonephila clavipes]
MSTRCWKTVEIAVNPRDIPKTAFVTKSDTCIGISDADCGAVGTGFDPEGDMDVCKCIVPLRHGGTLNSRRAAGLLVWLVEGEERWESSDHPQSVLPLNWGGTEPNRTVTYMVLKATANDRHHLALC